MSAPIIEIEGTSLRVYRRVDDKRTRIERLLRKPERTREIMGAFLLSSSPEVTMTRALNAPDTITISPISARSPL